MTTCKDCLHYEVCECEDCLIRVTEWVDKVEDYCGCFKPKADVVEVVRCKDCEKLKVCKNYQYCTEHSDGWGDNLVYVEDDDFCSFGIRKGSEVRE